MYVMNKDSMPALAPAAQLGVTRPVAIVSGPHVVSQSCRFTLSARKSRDVTWLTWPISGRQGHIGMGISWKDHGYIIHDHMKL